MRRAVCGRASSGAFRRNGPTRREPRAYGPGRPPGPLNKSGNFTPDISSHGARKSLGALTGPSRLPAARAFADDEVHVDTGDLPGGVDVVDRI